jgi:DNA-binding XRE family transcriptional regulator
MSQSAKAQNQVKKIRESKMMSKAELARKTGLSVQTIDRVEKGHVCRLDTKRKILLALGLKLEARQKVFADEA